MKITDLNEVKYYDNVDTSRKQTAKRGKRALIPIPWWNALLDWLKDNVGGLKDGDGDTFITVDSDPATDEDIIRLTANGVPRGYISELLTRIGGINTGTDHYFEISGEGANDEAVVGRAGAGDFRFRLDGVAEYSGSTTAEAALGVNNHMYRTEDGTLKLTDQSLDYSYRNRQSIILAASDESTTLDSGSVTFRMPYDFTVTEIKVSLNTASDVDIALDITDDGVAILSGGANDVTTGNTIQSFTNIANAEVAEDSVVVLSYNTVGATAGTGIKFMFIGYDR